MARKGSNMNPGDKVRKLHCNDGSVTAGKQARETFTVEEVRRHEPSTTPAYYAVLSDGTWEFVWNLAKA